MSETVDFFALAKEKKKETVTKKKPVKKQKEKLTFEEQYAAIKEPQLKRLVDYLLSLAGMKELMSQPDVSIAGMYKYIKTEAQKQSRNGVAWIDDQTVFGWGQHYYDEHGKVTR